MKFATCKQRWKSEIHLALNQYVVPFILLRFDFGVNRRYLIVDVVHLLGKCGYIVTSFIRIFFHLIDDLLLLLFLVLQLFNLCFILFDSLALLLLILQALGENILLVGYVALPSLNVYCKLRMRMLVVTYFCIETTNCLKAVTYCECLSFSQSLIAK